jgi:hypothetical protein
MSQAGNAAWHELRDDVMVNAWGDRLSVALDHGGGWQTRFAPLLVGSIGGLLYPRGPRRAAGELLLFALLLLGFFGQPEGVLFLLAALTVPLPLLWLGAFRASVAIRHRRTRPANPVRSS